MDLSCQSTKDGEDSLSYALILFSKDSSMPSTDQSDKKKVIPPDGYREEHAK